MPDKGGLQLIPETKRTVDIKRPGENKFLITGAIIMGVFLAAAFGVTTYENSFKNKISEIDVKLLEIENKRNKTAEKELKIFNSQSQLLTALLKDHTVWSETFIGLESKLKSQIHLLSLSADIFQKTMTVRGVASNYSLLAKQIAAFLKDDAITDLALTKVTSTPSGAVEFNLSIFFDPDKFVRKK